MPAIHATQERKMHGGGPTPFLRWGGKRRLLPKFWISLDLAAVRIDIYG
jgi:hypothetical protein